MSVIGKPPTWHLWQLCGHWAKAVRLKDDDSFDLPLMQEELADTLGITLVHMKQMLQALRSRNFIATRQAGTH